MIVRVCLETPFRGDYERNIRYADACLLDSLRRGECPFLGHLIYPRVLDDAIDVHRDLGIACHIGWLLASHLVVAYTDFGISHGMTLALDRAEVAGIPREFRTLGLGWEKLLDGVTGTTGFLSAAH